LGFLSFCGITPTCSNSPPNDVTFFHDADAGIRLWVMDMKLPRILRIKYRGERIEN
jgi:hypothetical protein